MMQPMTQEMENCFNNMDDTQKIRMFYELAVYITNNADETNDKDMENLFDDIANVVNDINNL